MAAWTLVYYKTKRALAIPLRVDLIELTPEQANRFRDRPDTSRPNFLLYDVIVDVFLHLQADIHFREGVEEGAGISRQILQYWGIAQDANGLFVKMLPEAQGYELVPRDATIDGASAGLLSALVIAAACLKKRWGHEVPFAYAATGTVDSVGTVGRVAYINEKLEEALQTLEAGSRIFYPRTHEDELTVAHTCLAATKGIRLFPVSTVEEALISFLDLTVCITTPASSATRLVSGKIATLHGTVTSSWGRIDEQVLVWMVGEKTLGTGPRVSWTPDEVGPQTLSLRIATPSSHLSLVRDCGVMTRPLDVVPDETLVVTIRVPSAGQRLVLGTTLELQGEAESSWHGTLEAETLAWRSDIEREQSLGVGQRLSWTPQRPGHHTLVLTATSPSGLSRIATTSLDVTECPAAKPRNPIRSGWQRRWSWVQRLRPWPRSGSASIWYGLGGVFLCVLLFLVWHTRLSGTYQLVVQTQPPQSVVTLLRLSFQVDPI